MIITGGWPQENIMLPFTDPGRSYRGIWLTDFDGTIKPEGANTVCAADKAALKRLKQLGWLRVVATGRSLFNFAKAWEPDLELDALIFSSGAGLCAWTPMGPGPALNTRLIEPALAKAAIAAARSLGFGFFAYHEPPDNHHFYYERPRNAPAGFDRRLEIFPVQSFPWPDDYFQSRGYSRLSQIMIMIPAALFDQAESDFRRMAPGLSVIRSTSPFGDGCLWLEVFGPGTSKGQAASDLAGLVSLTAGEAVALGNDYNDIDLLAWADCSFVTEDAPAEIKSGHTVMPSAGQGGLAWALNRVFGHD
ncbi:hypothetical protein C4J81_09160 [Deltaproteobacteria bacterium Smac51]|nr:hypothetical protein C4J81_09160 [Deltaproteobacteria bacterium Smac51]